MPRRRGHARDEIVVIVCALFVLLLLLLLLLLFFALLLTFLVAVFVELLLLLLLLLFELLNVLFDSIQVAVLANTSRVAAAGCLLVGARQEGDGGVARRGRRPLLAGECGVEGRLR